MLDVLAQLKNYAIGVGHDRMGAQICQSMESGKRHIVVIDRDTGPVASAKYKKGTTCQIKAKTTKFFARPASTRQRPGGGNWP